jgi:hypothetical protein
MALQNGINKTFTSVDGRKLRKSRKYQNRSTPVRKVVDDRPTRFFYWRKIKVDNFQLNSSRMFWFNDRTERKNNFTEVTSSNKTNYQALQNSR